MISSCNDLDNSFAYELRMFDNSSSFDIDFVENVMEEEITKMFSHDKIVLYFEIVDVKG